MFRTLATAVLLATAAMPLTAGAASDQAGKLVAV